MHGLIHAGLVASAAAIQFSCAHHIGHGADNAPDQAGDSGRDVTLVVDAGSFGSYPAALVSLDRAEVIPLLGSDGVWREIGADLWVEPGDPELAAMTARDARRLFDQATRPGHDVRLALTDVEYDSISDVPTGLTWVDRLPVSAIEAGTSFIVQSSIARYFKVRIDTWERGSRIGGDQEDKPSTATQVDGLVRLTFARVRDP